MSLAPIDLLFFFVVLHCRSHLEEVLIEVRNTYRMDLFFAIVLSFGALLSFIQKCKKLPHQFLGLTLRALQRRA